MPERQRDALKLLLTHLVDGDDTGKAGTTAQPLASICCTTDGHLEINGRAFQVVRGIPLGTDKIAAAFPGEVPIKPPPASFWANPFFEMPVFKPPVIRVDGATGIPHLGLDEALVFLLGDKL